MTYVTGIQEITNTNGSKVSIDYKKDASESNSKFNASIIPKKFFEFLYAINDEFKKLSNVEDKDTINAAITGFKIRDVDEGSKQEIQFIVNAHIGGVYFKNAKTDWREMRDIPLEVFKSWTLERQYAEAMNAIVAVFNEFQFYVHDNLPIWLEMDEEAGQLSLWERKEKSDIEDTLSDVRTDFHRKMQRMSDKDGVSVTISSGGKDLADFKPQGIEA